MGKTKKCLEIDITDIRGPWVPTETPRTTEIPSSYTGKCRVRGIGDAVAVWTKDETGERENGMLVEL